MNDLEILLHNLIREKGKIPFRDFMELALYHPQHGYYEKKRNVFGKKGDFYTAPVVHPVFGETIGQDFVKRWETMKCPTPLTLLEFGAGRGTLAKDILQGIRTMQPDLFNSIQYRIIERSSFLQNVQHETLTNLPVSWEENLERVGNFKGIVFSNELLDAAPVHIVEQGKDQLNEVYVTEKNGCLTECLGPLSNSQIISYLQDYGMPLQIGQRAEINLFALEWLKHLYTQMQSGYIITIDYGDESEILYEGRMAGTIRGYQQHRLSETLLEQVGEHDMTADVNFTALMKYGEQLGLQTVLYGTQSQYLIQAGIFEKLSTESVFDSIQGEGVKRNMAIKHLIMPGSMGERFKVLVQRKNTL